MGKYADFLSRSYSPASLFNPLRIYDAFNDLYNSSHGGERYLYSQFPLGRIRQFTDNYKRWQDSYNNTGLDPRYSSQYGSGGIPYLNDAIGSFAKPTRMMRSLAKMYGAEVELDTAWVKYQSYKASIESAKEWQNYQKLKQGMWY